MDECMKRWCESCDLCARCKPGPGVGNSPLQQFKVGAPLKCIALDIVGPLPETKNGNLYILVIGDYFTKWKEAFPIRDHTAITVADKLVTNFICHYGCPDQIHTDQGREFESHLFKQVCTLLGIEKTKTTPYHPQSDGLVERFNRTLRQMLSIFVSENFDDWDDLLPYLLMAYRATEHKSTKCSPNLMMLGRETNFPFDLIVGKPPNTPTENCPVEYVKWLQQTILNAHEIAHKNLNQAANRQKSDHDKNAKKREINVGKFVWRWYPPQANLKLGLGWTGPYLVIQKITDLTYRIQKSPASDIISVHIDHLKPYLGLKTPPAWNRLDTREVSIESTPTLDSPIRAELNQSVDLEYNHSPPQTELRSRAGRLIKPKQIFSP